MSTFDHAADDRTPTLTANVVGDTVLYSVNYVNIDRFETEDVHLAYSLLRDAVMQEQLFQRCVDDRRASAEAMAAEPPKKRGFWARVVGL